MISKIKKYLLSPELIISSFIKHCAWSFRSLLSDRLYLILLYRGIVGTWPNFKHPCTFTEKLNWMKLYHHKPIYTVMADKVKAKEWISELIGEQYIIPTLGVWENVDDIDFDKLPNQFVIKCNHNSGLGMYICKNKNQMDIEKVKAELNKGLKQDYYACNLEWPYKNIPRRIIAEKFMKNSDGSEILTDYKFFCFNGEPKFMYCSRDLEETPRTDFFDMDYNLLDMRMKDPNSNHPAPKPECFEDMKKLASILSKGIPHLRVDFYYINGQIYVGELTFYHNAGLFKFHPSSWDKTIGNWINIENLV